jgi:hypothetical protein
MADAVDVLHVSHLASSPVWLKNDVLKRLTTPGLKQPNTVAKYALSDMAMCSLALPSHTCMRWLPATAEG